MVLEGELGSGVNVVRKKTMRKSGLMPREHYICRYVATIGRAATPFFKAHRESILTALRSSSAKKQESRNVPEGKEIATQ